VVVERSPHTPPGIRIRTGRFEELRFPCIQFVLSRAVGFKTAPHLKPGRSGRRSDELADRFVDDQRLAVPVLRDEGKQPMFDAIPFAGPGG